MTINELAHELSIMYDNALDGEKATMIHLFGVRYSKIIRENNYSISEIIRNTILRDRTKISENYSPEINKGINLAKYVIEKKSLIEYINNN